MEARLVKVARWVGTAIILAPAVWVASIRIAEMIEKSSAKNEKASKHEEAVSKGDDPRTTKAQSVAVDDVVEDTVSRDAEIENSSLKEQKRVSDPVPPLAVMEKSEEARPQGRPNEGSIVSWFLGPDGRVKRRLGPSQGDGEKN